MPSNSLKYWSTIRAADLNEIENAHASVEGVGPGRRFATQQINQAYVVLLSSQFQGCCRDLHSECVGHLVRNLTDPAFEDVAFDNLTGNRALDRGNPTPGNIGSDFNRLGLPFWTEAIRHSAQNERRRASLEAMNAWRNAIAHQDFDPIKLGGRVTLQLRQVKAWRGTCNQLARSFEAVLRMHLHSRIGAWPW